MPFPRLSLRDAPPPAAGLPTRADVAMFVGLVGRTATAVPAALRDQLEAAGWAGSGPFARDPAAVEALLDVPVAVESWGAFAALYAWDARPAGGGGAALMPSRLGLAVRSFFAEGGTKAWIVRTGDPLPLIVQPQPRLDGEGKPRPIEPADTAASAAAAAATKRAVVTGTRPATAGRVALIPGFGNVVAAGEATAPATWRGVEHVWGVEDAAMLLLPDLPELLAPAPEGIADLPGPPQPPEDWKPCAPVSPGFRAERRQARPSVSAPRLDRAGYREWGHALRDVLDRLDAPRGAAHRRDVMLVASLPLPATVGASLPPPAEDYPLAILDAPGSWLATPGDPPGGVSLLAREAIGSARLQLVWPWVETTASGGLPEGLEGAEGVFAGTVARTALSRGAFRSAAGAALPSVRRLWPELGSGDLERALPGRRADWLGDRLSLVGARLAGFALLSDATMASDVSWRAGGTSRLVGIILRAVRWVGQERLFAPAGPALWSAIRRDIEALLEQLRQAGALAGANPADAYEVRCDSSTMTPADIDQGRTIVRVAVNPAQPIGWVTVTLAMGGNALPLEAAA